MTVLQELLEKWRNGFQDLHDASAAAPGNEVFGAQCLAYALPPVTSRRMPGVISFTPPARDPVER